MITKVVNISKLHDPNQAKEDRAYWANQSALDRLNAVEFMRKQFYVEYPERLQRVFTIIKQK